jgi:hypothetical protein
MVFKICSCLFVREIKNKGGHASQARSVEGTVSRDEYFLKVEVLKNRNNTS